MTKQKIIQKKDSLEKLVRYALGIAPDEFGLSPDEEGFVPVKELIAAIRDEDGFRGITENRIMELVNQSVDKSLELKDKLIRLDPTLSQLPPEIPEKIKKPKLLYIGLKPTAWPIISKNGLFPKTGEKKIQLFNTKEEAYKIAHRFCPDPVIITVHTSEATENGAIFCPYSERMWLTENEISPRFLSGPPIVTLEEKKPEARKQEKKTFVLPESFLLAEPIIHQGKKKGKYEDKPDWKVQLRRDRRKSKTIKTNEDD